ncbi:MAG: diacylglycerol kinase family protein [Bacteroidales bacterium]|nr:diacylglycerol kinase family protein [Bacteroidales bacterium]
MTENLPNIPDTNRFSIKRRLKSFRYAFSGLRVLVREEHNARIHLFATVCVIVMGVLLRISCTEWVAVALAIGLVFGMEAVNSAVENICDFVCPERDARIKKIKDLAAAAVLLSAIAALAVGLFIFIPKIMSLCHGA